MVVAASTHRASHHHNASPHTCWGRLLQRRVYISSRIFVLLICVCMCVPVCIRMDERMDGWMDGWM